MKFRQERNALDFIKFCADSNQEDTSRCLKRRWMFVDTWTYITNRGRKQRKASQSFDVEFVNNVLSK